jgi:hypothetical protein
MDPGKSIPAGRLPITSKNIKIIERKEDKPFNNYLEEYSLDSALTIIGMNNELVRRKGAEFFSQFDGIGDVLLVEAAGVKEID